MTGPFIDLFSTMFPPSSSWVVEYSPIRSRMVLVRSSSSTGIKERALDWNILATFKCLGNRLARGNMSIDGIAVY